MRKNCTLSLTNTFAFAADTRYCNREVSSFRNPTSANAKQSASRAGRVVSHRPAPHHRRPVAAKPSQAHGQLASRHNSALG
ncbi:unnamed protein product [Ceratitis capitata]|uniref:(Mediterranean fruit fly) hypothetical protein n=1 Tax=Ceratitis capitata TaxID=7213 RepID=A0A811V6B2_CERCA|nr:unnamed protein product [Ceratitis capitata]